MGCDDFSTEFRKKNEAERRAAEIFSTEGVNAFLDFAQENSTTLNVNYSIFKRRELLGNLEREEWCLQPPEDSTIGKTAERLLKLAGIAPESEDYHEVLVNIIQELKGSEQALKEMLAQLGGSALAEVRS